MKSPFAALRNKLKWPRPITIDLSRASHRVKLLVFAFVMLLVGLGLVAGGVAGYDYSESTEFCGTICHSMYPQFERHQRSSHSNVACAHCHVGPGAAAFIQSKIDGTRQLISTILDNYHRPIKSPVVNLRPARETCETCHTPTSFQDNIVKTIKHYDDDEENTLIQNTLILKMGGWKETTGFGRGIHWHVSSKVYYIPLDEQRQVIAWVGIEQPDGSLKEYFSRDLYGMGQTDFVDKARAEGTIRELDCIDCHNRAAHYIPYPGQAVDQAIADGLISTDLPYIRKDAVAILDTRFETREDAFVAIDGLADVYKSESADLQEKAVQAIAALKKLYDATNYPDMELDWKTNPNNVRHTPTQGCFRCHDDKHVSVDLVTGQEQTISVQCNLCHTVPIVARGSETVVESPVIVGDVPGTHADYRWTIEHRSVTDAQKQECYNCHGQSFCNNGACHNLDHPENMLFTHAEEYKNKGGQVCYTCHQNVTCTRCHSEGVGNIFKP